MRKITNVLLTLLILVALVLPFTLSQTTYAYEEQREVKTERLSSKETRLDEYTKVVRVGTVASGKYEATISSLPQTMPDLVTLITTEWLEGRGEDGVPYLVTGNNLVSAKVTGTRVTAQYEGKQGAWDPVITVAGVEFELASGPIVVDDPINENYWYNTIEWTYTGTLGNFLFKREYTVTRYLRQIEGALIEYYKLLYDPNGDVEIDLNYKYEPDFYWDKLACAWDSEYNSLAVRGIDGSKIVEKSELARAELTYPVFIDPTLTFTSSSSDGYLDSGFGPSWSTQRSLTSSDDCSDSADYIVVSSRNWGSYTIERAYVYFNTASLTSAATITSATLKLYSLDLADEGGTFYIRLQSGMPTYPHDPLALSDFLYNHYSGSGGQISSTSIGYSYGYKTITLTSEGRGWINKTGYTKLCLRTNYDIDNTAPPDVGSGWGQKWQFSSYEYGTGYAPKLTVTYTLPTVKPAVHTYKAYSIDETSATLKGKVTDDGGASCSVRFGYGTTPGSYSVYTSWQSGYETGDTFTKNVTGLLRGTTYYYTAEASNSAGSSDADEESFTTCPGTPSNFASTPDDEENDLTWTKGSGADRTMVRFSTTSYPSSPTSGTQIYFDTGNSYNHTGLTNGTTYYYSAWSEIDGQYSPNKATISGIPYTMGPPSVTTYDATEVGITTATLNGYLGSLSGYDDADVWFQYYWGAGSWTDNETTPDTMTDIGNASEDVSSLPAETVIHFRIAATGDGGTSYGSGLTFTTGEASAPAMETKAASGVTRVAATLHGKVTDDGGGTVTAWFQYGTTPEFGFETATAAGLFSGDTLYASLTDLENSTTYYFRVVGQSSAGTGYGEGLDFTTGDPESPTVTTLPAMSVGAEETTLKGELDNDGGVPCDVCFEYGLTEELGSSTGWQTGITSGTTFQAIISDLEVGEVYYFRAVAQNISGSDYGELLSFETVFGAPLNFAAYSLGSDSISLQWERVGDQTGIFMKAGSFPVDRLDGVQVYFGGADSFTVSGLDIGTTYFFRAWSWKSDGNWSDEMTEAVATTGAASATGDINLPNVAGDEPGLPEGWFQTPSGSVLSNWEFSPLIGDVGTKIGVTEGAMWMIIAMVVIIAASFILFSISGSILVMIGGTLLAIIMAAATGLVPGWIALVFVIIGGGVAYLTRSIA